VAPARGAVTGRTVKAPICAPVNNNAVRANRFKTPIAGDEKILLGPDLALATPVPGIPTWRGDRECRMFRMLSSIFVLRKRILRPRIKYKLGPPRVLLGIYQGKLDESGGAWARSRPAQTLPHTRRVENGNARLSRR
jgi:hypothetical protein